MATLEPAYFDKVLTGYRYAETQRGDTLPIIAARELGDANRWPELAWINDLIPPFVTDDHDLARPRVLLTGQSLLVPAPTAQTAIGDPDPARLFDTDCVLSRGLLEADNGDFAVVSGLDNLRQQIVHRVITERGDMLWHPRYGCLVRRLIGVVNGSAAGILAAKYVEATIKQDLRVKRVNQVTAKMEGDTLRIEAEFEPIAGRTIDFTLVL